jgi:hypothetical protein
MALDPVIRGTPSDPVWGTTNTMPAGWRVKNIKRKQQTEKDLSLDNNGVPTGSVTIKGLKEYTFDAEALASTVIPVPGDTLTLCGDSNCIIETVEEAWERKGRKGINCTAHSFPV